ncbi:MAG: hypothetical protein SPJ84_04520 [Fusobacterium gastrosuis]|uniref:hypothetical protein n=1 Tax=Fusobacterium TaxID=848 RepID=UPI0025BFBF77|nr:hypothetical protein [Fusobacterium sp.]MCI7223118.1 hypothetical protein [Fusobacterium sp.]MDY5795073.1 hypothetical protein [Fusobacterium gastrosuis]
MKIKCYYRTYNIYSDNLEAYADIIDIQNYNINYAKYLFNFIKDIKTLETIEYISINIEKIEFKEIEEFSFNVDIPDIYVYIYIEKTLFEHNLGWNDDWECPTIVVKKALEGWKKFLEMPREKDTVYKFEIPDSDL